MKKIFLLLALLISSRVFSQTTPPNLVQTNTMTWYRQTTTGDMFAYRGLALGYYHFLDSAKIAQMISSGSVTVTASNGLNKVGNDIRLGGTLTNSTDIFTGTSYFQVGDGAASYFHINGTSEFLNGSFILQAGDFSRATSQIGGNANNLHLQYQDQVNGRLKEIRLDSSKMSVKDQANKGLSYAGDYSTLGKLDDRWIPDWGSVKLGLDSAGAGYAILNGNNHLNGNNEFDGDVYFAGEVNLSNSASISPVGLGGGNSPILFKNASNGKVASTGAAYYDGSGMQWNLKNSFGSGVDFNNTSPNFNNSFNFNNGNDFTSQTDNRILVYSPLNGNRTGYINFSSIPSSNSVNGKQDTSTALKTRDTTGINPPVLTRTSANTLYGSISQTSQQYLGKKLLTIGDSYSNMNTYQPYLANIFGFTYTNNSVSGSQITPGHEKDINDGTRRSSFVERVRSVFDPGNSANYPDYLIIYGGTNDYAYQLTPGHPNDLITPTFTGGLVDSASVVGATFYGSLNWIVNYVTTNSPITKIFFFTPIQTIQGAYQTNGLDPRVGLYYAQVRFVDAIKTVGANRAIPTLSLFDNSGITYENNHTYTSDFVHPNGPGWTLIETAMKAFFQTVGNPQGQAVGFGPNSIIRTDNNGYSQVNGESIYSPLYNFQNNITTDASGNLIINSISTSLGNKILATLSRSGATFGTINGTNETLTNSSPTYGLYSTTASTGNFNTLISQRGNIFSIDAMADNFSSYVSPFLINKTTLNMGFGGGTTTPSALMHLTRAGVATAGGAPFKMTTGVSSQTTVEQGAFNWDGSYLYVGSSATPVNRTFAFLDNPQFTTANFSGLITPTSGITVGKTSGFNGIAFLRPSDGSSQGWVGMDPANSADQGSMEMKAGGSAGTIRLKLNATYYDKWFNNGHHVVGNGTFTDNNYFYDIQTAGTAGYFHAGNFSVDASGNPIVPTATTGTNTTQGSSTAFVNASITAYQTAVATETNKSLSGSSNTFSNIPLTTAVTGILPVTNGGSGVGTITGLLKGNGTSAFTAAVAGTDYLAPTALTTLIDNQISKTTSYTIVSGDFSSTKKTTLDCFVDASAGGVTITLPSATTFAGYTINVVKTDASANTVTINTIVGSNTLTTQNQTRTFITNTTGSWYNL